MTEQEQRLEASAQVLCNRVAAFCNGRKINNVTISTVEMIVSDHASHASMNGLKFPSMVLVVLERHGWIQIVRRDASGADIQQLIRNLIKKFPDISPDDIAPAIRRAFPSYKPRELIHAGVH